MRVVQLTALVMPADVLGALNEVAGAKEGARLREEAMLLARELPVNETCHLNLAAFLQLNHASSPDSGAALAFVQEVLKRDLAVPSLLAGVETALRVRDWPTLSLLLPRLPPDMSQLKPPSLPLHDAVGVGQNEIMGKLLALGADPDAESEKKGSGRETAMHVACRVGNVEGVEMLLARGASLAVRETEQGETPLHLAAQSTGAQAARIVELLLASGADQTATNRRKQRPVDLAKDKQVRIARPQIRCGASDVVRDSRGVRGRCGRCCVST